MYKYLLFFLPLIFIQYIIQKMDSKQIWIQREINIRKKKGC